MWRDRWRRPGTPPAVQKIRLCAVCCDLTESDPCGICGAARRAGGLICVAAQPPDLAAGERTGDSGRWRIESGTLSVRDGPGPSEPVRLLRDLRVSDWVTADGELTLTGRKALARWLE